MKILPKSNRLSFAIGVAVAGATILPDIAQAQEEKVGRIQLEEVIVTAEKREQSLQEVPVAISAFTADMMEARGINTPQDLQQVVPSLVIGEQHSGPAKVTVRGVGSENIFPGGDPGVPVHINGHYTQSTAYVLRDMLDVERVEVLRGPQGTLYGRNAIGGNINIITKRPTEEFEGLVSATIGSYDKRNIQAVVSGPIVGNLRGRLAVSNDDRDGYVENVGVSGDDRDTSDYTSVRGSLLFDLTDNIELYLSAYHFDDKGNPAQRFITEYPTGPGGTPRAPFFGQPNFWELNNAGTNPTLTDPFKISNNTPSRQENKSEGGSLDVNWDLGSIELRSLSAYDKSSWQVATDLDASSVVNRELRFVMPFETFTQEFQLLSTGESDLNWVLGLFYYDEESSFTFQSLREPDNATSQDEPRRFLANKLSIDSKSLGAYGQIDYSLTDKLEVVAGLRYSKDKKEAEDAGYSIGVEGQPLPPPAFSAIPSRGEEWSKVTGKLGINYHLYSEAMLYASYSRGYKAGGFNQAQEDPYDPEQVNAWEAGIKSQWLDNRVQMNLAAFYYEYENKQDYQRFTGPVPGTFIFHILNASASTNKGVELEFQAHLTNSLFVDMSVGYLEAEFDDFETIDALRGNQNFILDGNKLPFSPDWTVHVGAQYDWKLPGNLGALSIRGDYTWVDEQYSNAFNRDASSGLGGTVDFVPSYYLVNTRLQWESVDANWLAELYVRNLTDEVILSNPFVGRDGTWGTYLAPRTYGLKLQYNF